MNNDEIVEMYGKMRIALDIITECEEFAAIIPEVRTNLVYTRKNPKDKMDVLAVDGRITAVDGRPHASGPAKFGASSHMARFLIGIHKAFPSVRAGIDFANDPQLTRFLEEYCSRKGWSLIGIDRSKEPDDIKDQEGLSVPWKAKEVVKAAGGRMLKIAYESGAVGKEPVSVLLGEDPVQVVREVCALAKAYKAYSTPPVKVGKIGKEVFESILLGRLGRRSDKVIVPPMTGVDAGVVDIGNGNVLIIAEDPIFSIPGFPLDFLGWATVHIGASDVAVMGVAPQFMLYSLLMPPGTGDVELKTIVDSIHKAADDLGISIVGGHTGYYPGLPTPTIGGVTVFSVVRQNKYVTPTGARAGDDVILTKGPAIETTCALAMMNKKELILRYDEEIVEKAVGLRGKMSVVKDALLAMEAGGVTAMHDATEGGVIGGLYEIAYASEVGMEIDESKFVYPDEVRIVCEYFGIDPVAAIAEGSLLITARPLNSKAILKKLKEGGIDASVIGKVKTDKRTRTMKRRDGSVVELCIPEQDPFWPIFFESISKMAGDKI
ncbi:MAG: thiamine-phosphate synthase family protein [Methanomassiliicoccales archaeon]